MDVSDVTDECNTINTQDCRPIATAPGPFHITRRHNVTQTMTADSLSLESIAGGGGQLTLAGQTLGPHVNPQSDRELQAITLLARQIRAQLDFSDSFVDGEWMSSGRLATWLQQAEKILGEDIVYNDELIKSLDLQDITEGDYLPNDMELANGATLDSLISSSVAQHCIKGQSVAELQVTLQAVTNKDRVIDLVHYGQRKFMKAEFRPNGGREVSNGGSYMSMRQICNQSIYDLHRKRQCLLFSYDALVERGMMKELHVSPLVWTTKAGKVLGRTCLHASKASKHFKSYNESIDYEASRQMYTKPILPLLPDIAELACQQRMKYPGQILAGATVDVSTAYNQFAMAPSTAKLTATQISIKGSTGGLKKIIVIYLVGMFGCGTAGDVYCQIAQAVDELHNQGRATPRSKTYIDDGLLIDSAENIQSSMEQYIAHVESLLGNRQTIQREKVKVWPSELEGIGWHFDFTSWTVRPKAKGMAKMLLCLFRDIPLDSTTVSEANLDKLTGLLTWYADGLPAGSKFISSLFACKRKMEAHSKRAILTEEAKRDLQWWRSLLVVSFEQPMVLAASISSVRRALQPERFMHTDASTSVGGGAYVSLSQHTAALAEFSGAPIRWTVAEIEMFQRMKISINVLEYFTVVYYVMSWGELFRGMVVHVKCDNTAAVSWIMRNRAKNNIAAESLSRIFSLFCLSYNITLICTHIKGIDNTLADYLSRDLELAPQDWDEPTMVEDGEEWSGWPRQALCRQLLQICITTSSGMHGQQILKVLMGLRTRAT